MSLLTLTGPPAAPGAARPVVLVALKGPLPAPKRTVDTSLLTSWLTLRAVEQHSKQIDAMERAGRERRAAAPSRTPLAADMRRITLTGECRGFRAEYDERAFRRTAQAPALPPPVNVPAAPKPRAAPRADNARSAARDRSTARSTRRAELTAWCAIRSGRASRPGVRHWLRK